MQMHRVEIASPTGCSIAPRLRAHQVVQQLLLLRLRQACLLVLVLVDTHSAFSQW
jgi:hypothetical protein